MSQFSPADDPNYTVKVPKHIYKLIRRLELLEDQKESCVVMVMTDECGKVKEWRVIKSKSEYPGT